MFFSNSSPSFFDIENQLDKIHELNGFLVQLNTLIDWCIFLPLLSSLRPAREPSKDDRPPFDPLLMLKILVLQSLYNLSDDNMELFIRDRLSFREFLGLVFSDRVPDSRTSWFFAEMLKEQNMERYLFDRFNEELSCQGFSPKGGCRQDGTFVEVPKPHNSKSEKEQTQRYECCAALLEILGMNGQSRPGSGATNQSNWDNGFGGKISTILCPSDADKATPNTNEPARNNVVFCIGDYPTGGDKNLLIELKD
jgi:hypothetical protein